MSDEINQGQNIVEDTTSATPTDQKPAEIVIDEEKEALENSKNPERTKAYIERLKTEKQELEARLQQVPQPQVSQRSVLEAYLPQVGDPGLAPVQTQVAIPQNLTSSQVENIQKSLVDENGYVDGAALERELQRASVAERQAREANERSSRLEQQIQKMNIDQQTLRLYESFPELDPSNKAFSPEAYDLVKKELLNELVTTGQQDAIGAANRMSRYFRKDVTQVQKQTQLQQATATVGSGTNSSKRAMDSKELEELKRKSRYDRNALAERLKRSGY
jgi:hypothetical protein